MAHNHFASTDIDPTCSLCAIAVAFAPVEGPAPEELLADSPCVEASCSHSCGQEGPGEPFTHDGRVYGEDVLLLCQCEHHDPMSTFAVAGVNWVRDGRP